MPDTLADVAALDPEDAKLVTLARSARVRSGAPEGAAVRDADGRTYAASTVALPALALSALAAAVAQAAGSGARSLEAAAVVTEADQVDAAVLTGLGEPTLLVAGVDGAVRR